MISYEWLKVRKRYFIYTWWNKSLLCWPFYSHWIYWKYCFTACRKFFQWCWSKQYDNLSVAVIQWLKWKCYHFGNIFFLLLHQKLSFWQLEVWAVTEILLERLYYCEITNKLSNKSYQQKCPMITGWSNLSPHGISRYRSEVYPCNTPKYR